MANGNEYEYDIHAVTGKVQWSDLGAALLLNDAGQEIVVQRHTVDRWQIVGA